MTSFIKDIFRVGFSQVLIIVFGIISSIITARMIGPEGNGVIASLTVYPSFIMSIGSLGIGQSTTYFLGKGLFTEEQIKKAISQIWILTTIISLIVSYILVYCFTNSGSSLTLVFLVLLPIPFNLFNIYNSGFFLAKNDFKTFNKINWIPSLITLIATLIFVVLFKWSIKGALIASVGGSLVMFFLLLFKNKFLNFFSLRFDWDIIKQMLLLGTVYATSLFVINLNYRIDVILLDKLSTPFELGIYAKTTGITQYLWQVPMLFSTIVFARSAVSKNEKYFSLKVAQLLRVSSIVILVLSVGIWFLSEVIIVGMYGEKFREGASVLKCLLPGVIILTIFKVLNMDLAGKGKPWVSLKAMVPALIINIGLNILLIPYLGAKGAAISSMVSYSLAGILFLFFYSKCVDIPIGVILGYNRKDFDYIFKLLKK